MESTNAQIWIDLKGHCVLCFRKYRNLQETTENGKNVLKPEHFPEMQQFDNSPANNKALCKRFLMLISRVLQIPNSEMRIAPQTSLTDGILVSKRWDDLISGNLCSSCAQVSYSFCDLQFKISYLQLQRNARLCEIQNLICGGDMSLECRVDRQCYEQELEKDGISPETTMQALDIFRNAIVQRAVQKQISPEVVLSRLETSSLENENMSHVVDELPKPESTTGMEISSEDDVDSLPSLDYYGMGFPIKKPKLDSEVGRNANVEHKNEGTNTNPSVIKHQETQTALASHHFEDAYQSKQCEPPKISSPKEKEVTEKLPEVPSVCDEEFACNICGGLLFDSQQSLLAHYLIHDASTVACPLCPRFFRSEQRLGRHRRLVHRIKLKVYLCTKCVENNTFKSVAELKHHRKLMHDKDVGGITSSEGSNGYLESCPQTNDTIGGGATLQSNATPQGACTQNVIADKEGTRANLSNLDDDGDTTDTTMEDSQNAKKNGEVDESGDKEQLSLEQPRGGGAPQEQATPTLVASLTPEQMQDDMLGALGLRRKENDEREAENCAQNQEEGGDRHTPVADPVPLGGMLVEESMGQGEATNGEENNNSEQLDSKQGLLDLKLESRIEYDEDSCDTVILRRRSLDDLDLNRGSTFNFSRDSSFRDAEIIDLTVSSDDDGFDKESEGVNTPCSPEYIIVD